MAFEVVEFLVDVVVNIYVHACGRKRKTKVEEKKMMREKRRVSQESKRWTEA